MAARLADGGPRTLWLEWLPVGFGLLLLYAPTFYGLAATLWRDDDHAHGPVILAVVAWLIWRKRAALASATGRSAPLAGLSVLAFGLLAYVLGRSQGISVIEIAALAPILAGSLLAMRGQCAVRALWFPLFFIIFLVPLPETLVDSLTGSLKQHVSGLAESVLYAAHYPVARDGVMLTVGQYQLLVADACSGLNSMFSLAALGLLYLYTMQRKSWLHTGLVIFTILPIAFAANIIRVLALVLVTYHLGDEAGQGFLHGSAGLLLVLVALFLIITIDVVLARLLLRRM